MSMPFGPGRIRDLHPADPPGRDTGDGDRSVASGASYLQRDRRLGGDDPLRRAHSLGNVPESERKGLLPADRGIQNRDAAQSPLFRNPRNKQTLHGICRNYRQDAMGNPVGDPPEEPDAGGGDEPGIVSVVSDAGDPRSVGPFPQERGDSVILTFPVPIPAQHRRFSFRGG